MSPPDPPRIIIAGGGTGGHLFPGVAVAEEIERLAPGAQLTFVGTERGIEARVIPALGRRLELMRVQGIKGAGRAGTLAGLARLPAAALRAVALLYRHSPDLVISVGGYAAGPLTACAALLGVPTALLEQNIVPGVTNRLLGRLVRRAFLTYEQSASYFPRARCQVAGNPLRRELVERAHAHTYEAPADGEPVRVLVLGGSGGSLALNQHVPEALAALAGQGASLQIRHQVGKQRGDLAAQIYRDHGLGEGPVELVEFIEDMASAYERAHLIIGRAGATTIAEVLAFGVPALYVPFPGAADDHQTKNALAVVERGAGVMLEQRALELDPDRLVRLVGGLVRNPASLQNLARRARQLGRPEAGAEIARACLALAGHPRHA